MIFYFIQVLCSKLCVLFFFQGRSDVIDIFFKRDTDNIISSVLYGEKDNQIARSPAFYAITNDHQNCASWYLGDFLFFNL